MGNCFEKALKSIQISDSNAYAELQLWKLDNQSVQYKRVILKWSSYDQWLELPSYTVWETQK
jgi:hypothetical protein